MTDELERHPRSGRLDWRSFFIGFQIGRLASLDEAAIRSCVQTYLRGLGYKRRKEP